MGQNFYNLGRGLNEHHNRAFIFFLLLYWSKEEMIFGNLAFLAYLTPSIGPRGGKIINFTILVPLIPVFLETKNGNNWLCCSQEEVNSKTFKGRNTTVDEDQ